MSATTTRSSAPAPAGVGRGRPGSSSTASTASAAWPPRHDLFRVPHIARRAAKVAAVADVDERHLFIGIGDGGLPRPLYLALGRPGPALPDDEPDVEHAALTHLWLATAWAGSPLLCWHRGVGWSVHDPGR